MPTPWCEFCATEMLIFMVVWAAAVATRPIASDMPMMSLLSFMKSPVIVEKIKVNLPSRGNMIMSAKKLRFCAGFR